MIQRLKRLVTEHSYLLYAIFLLLLAISISFYKPSIIYLQTQSSPLESTVMSISRTVLKKVLAVETPEVYPF